MPVCPVSAVTAMGNTKKLSGPWNASMDFPFPSPGFGFMCSRSLLMWCIYMTLDQPRKMAKLRGSTMSSLIGPLLTSFAWQLLRPLPLAPAWDMLLALYVADTDLSSWLILDLPHYYGLVCKSPDCWLNVVTCFVVLMQVRLRDHCPPSIAVLSAPVSTAFVK